MDAVAAGLACADSDARPQDFGTDMMNRTGVVIAAALLAACGASGQGDGQAKAAAAATKPVDVAGVRLGMTLSEAEAAMRAGGWIVKRDPGKSWNQEVDHAISVRRSQSESMFLKPEGVGGLIGRKGEEYLGVTLAQTPQGERVQSVGYSAPSGNRTAADIRTDLIKRYGQAVVDAGSNHGPLLYYAPQGKNGSNLTTFIDSQQFRLVLSRGVAADAAWLASVNRAADAKAGPIGKSF